MTDQIANEVNTEAPSQPKKRSLFSKSAIAKASADEEAVAFFSRANELFPQRISEEQKKREKKLQRIQRKRSSMSAEEKESTPPADKRRKVSLQSNSREEHSSEGSGLEEEAPRAQGESTNTTPESRKSRRGSSNHDYPGSPTSLSARYNRALNKRKQEEPKKAVRAKGYISLSDTDSDEADTVCLPVRKPAPDPITLDDDDYDKPTNQISALSQIDDDNQISDEEFPELVQQARERERMKVQQQLNVANDNNHGSNDEDVFLFDSKVDLDPTVEILITSKMEGTKPLMVRRKMSQRLKEVRYAWCDKQEINSDETGQALKDAIFLTWRNTQLYDSTTCRALPGLKRDGNGRFTHEGDGFAADGKLHFEAWTLAAFEEQKKRNADKQKRGEGIDEELERQKRDEDAGQKCKIIMKAKDMDPFKLLVRPHTTIAKMISAFRAAKEISDDKDISLYFDGDKLDPESTIADTELGDIDDIDTVEVHIK